MRPTATRLLLPVLAVLVLAVVTVSAHFGAMHGDTMAMHTSTDSTNTSTAVNVFVDCPMTEQVVQCLLAESKLNVDAAVWMVGSQSMVPSTPGLFVGEAMRVSDPIE